MKMTKLKKPPQPTYGPHLPKENDVRDRSYSPGQHLDSIEALEKLTGETELFLRMPVGGGWEGGEPVLAAWRETIWRTGLFDFYLTHLRAISYYPQDPKEA